MADTIFNKFCFRIGDASMDLENDQFKICLLTNSYTIDATDELYADLSDEVVGVGYTAGGEILANVTWAEAGGVSKFDADNAEWGPVATILARYAVIYDDTSTGDKLVCLFDFGEDKEVTAGVFTIVFNANGIFTIVQS